MPFISKNENLLTITNVSNGGQKDEFNSSFSTQETFESASDVYCDDTCVKFFRVDGNHNFEDVTEEVAQAYIEGCWDHNDQSFEGHGTFVESSKALEDHLTSLHAKNAWIDSAHDESRDAVNGW